MCHLLSVATLPVLRISQGLLRILNSIENTAVIALCWVKICFRAGILSKGRQRLIRIVFRITVFCTTSVQKWFFSSHSGTAPTKITSKTALSHSKLRAGAQTGCRCLHLGHPTRHPEFPARALQKWIWSR
jgi:hypothetical protein